MLRCPARPYMIVMVSTTHVHRPRARPQRDHEADRDDLEPALEEHVVQRGGDDVVHGGRGQQPRSQVQHLGAELGDGGHVEALGDEADGAGQAEDQRGQRQQGEERRLGGQARHPVAQTRAEGLGDHPPGPTPHLHSVGEPTGATRSARGPASDPGDPVWGWRHRGVVGEVLDEGRQVLAATDSVGALAEYGERVTAVGQEVVGDDPVRRRGVERNVVQPDIARPGCRTSSPCCRR